jgi:uncharacterized membrane protein
MSKKRYAAMTAGGAVGMVAAFLQTLEKIELLKNKDAILPCNFNSIFNCSAVLNAPQSAVFGFPNSIMCMVLFTIFFTVGLAGLLGSQLSRGIRLTTHVLSLFTLGFALWFLWQSTYVIGALCIFCLFCFAGLIVVNAMWLRINAPDLPISDRAKAWLNYGIRKQYDLLGWALLATIVGIVMVLNFM